MGGFVTLADASRAYLTAGPNSVVRQEGSLTEYDRGEHSLLVWVDESTRVARREMTQAQRQDCDRLEAQWLEQFQTEMAGARPGSVGVLLTPSRLGLSAGFTSGAKQWLSSACEGAQGGIRVPVEFFDTDYRADGADRVSVMRRIFATARRTRRVPQPFVVDGGTGGEDVVEMLTHAFTQPPSRPKLWIVDGSAGGGKSVAFRALVLALHDAFIDAKGRGAWGARPIAFTERQLRGGSGDGDGGRRVGDLIEASIATELAQPVTRAQFEWLLVNGHTAWMFDGLDEIYSGDGAFFDTVASLMDAPGGVAQILLCTRDSLLTTSAHLRDFVAHSRERGRDVEVIGLAAWEEPAWRHLAWIRLEEEREGSRGSPKIEAFLQQVADSPVLRDLMGLPFYCDEILKMADDDKLGIQGDFDVLSIIVNRMLQREWNKDLFDWSDFVSATGMAGLDAMSEEERHGVLSTLKNAGRNALLDILQSLAHARQRSSTGSPGPLPVEVARSLTVMLSGLDPGSDNGRDAMMAVVQFAFFGAGETDDTVTFSHPILADFLAARHAVQRIRDHQGDLVAMKQAIGPLTVPPGTVFVRYLRHAQQEDRAFRRHVHAAMVNPDVDPALSTFLGLLLR